MFFLLAAVVFFATAAISVSRGPAYAARVIALPIFLLAPAWLRMNVGSLMIDLRTASGMGLLVGALTSGSLPRIGITDTLAFLFALSVGISQYLTGGFGPLTGPDVFRRWFLPYLVGRLMFSSREDFAPAARIVGALVAGVGFLAAFECFTGVNPWTILFPKTFSLLMEGEGFRHGLKRGQASMEHPIFLGMALVLMLPFAADATRQAFAGKCSRLWLLSLPGLLAGVFSTLSRGPMLVALAGLGGWFFFRFPKWRLPILGLLLASGALVMTYREEALEALAAMGGESKNEETRIILIDGEPTEYTGTLHRILLWKVYDQAIQSAGWFGHGFAMSSVQLEESIAQRFGSIDNGYLLLFLQHGWAALILLVLLMLGTILRVTWVAWNGSPGEVAVTGSLCGVLVGMLILLNTVWLAPDFSGLLIATFGWVASFGRLSGNPDFTDNPAPNAPSANILKIQKFPARRLHSGVAPLAPLKEVTP